MKNSMYYVHALSALHVGAGQGAGIIDLPIAREKANNLPQVPGSSIKGVLRDELASDTTDEWMALFGPKTGETASEHAGALAVGDAHLLCLPVRSWCGTFAWATCPMILYRYQRDLQCNHVIPEPVENAALHCTDSKVKDNEKIYLEDLDLNAVLNAEADKWAKLIAESVFPDITWQDLFKQRFVILPDNLFDFLAETAAEIRSRIRIEEGTRTVQSGALWYEEYLPTETLLWGEVACDRSRKPGVSKDQDEMLALLPTTLYLQMGGNATVGAGRVKWQLARDDKGNEQ